MTTELRKDPPLRKDGRCAVCRLPIDTKPRPGVPPLLYVDPFCSSSCAKAYHDVQTSLPLPKGRPRYLEEEEAAS